MSWAWLGRSAVLTAFVGLSALGSGGCVSAGLAAFGPVFTAVYAVTDRSVERTLPADLGTAWDATLAGMAQVAVRVKEVDRSGRPWSLKGAGDHVTLTATLDPITPRLTKLSLRVEDGGITADKKTAEEILNQVSATLARPPSLATGRDIPANASTPIEAMTSLKREIERLGAKLTETHESRPPAGRETVTIQPGRILVVPTSLGVESVPSALPEGPPPDAPVVSKTHPMPPQSLVKAQPSEATPQPEGTVSATTLHPVEALKPVPGLPAKPSEQ